ncbi:hypothetical protein RS030_149 [Cryptosporidium xiaoi]|uniref:Vacuolar membrane-associated protein Iml1 N-terminal domain-containing protein n=1 Tax=Cryptosporidium xiaoi TaxID=659607 RepID=A0AAV9XZD3_9CRYT
MIRQYVEIIKVRRVSELELNKVEISIPEVRVSQRDLWYFERSLIGKILYNGTSPIVALDSNNYLQINITGMTVNEEHSCDPVPYASGFVTENTHFIIKPRSIRIIMIILISREFFLYSSFGFEWWKGILSFFKEYLNTNKKHVEYHFLSVIFTWRVKNEKQDESGSVDKDYYQVFWEGIVSDLTLNKQNIDDFIDKLRIKVYEILNDRSIINNLVSYCNSNLLESINIALTQLQSDFIDGSLIWSGRNIKILSSGPPVLVTDNSNYKKLLVLSKITEVRFLKTSITCDFISFSELDWYHSLNIYISNVKENRCLDVFKTVKLKLPMLVYYFKSSIDKNSRGLFDMSSTITLIDEYMDNVNEKVVQEEVKDVDKRQIFDLFITENDSNEEDIDLVVSGEYRSKINRRITLNNAMLNSDKKNMRLKLNNNKGINNKNSFRNMFGSALPPLTTTNLSKIAVDESIHNNSFYAGGGRQKITNWTITPREDLFSAYCWNNYNLINQLYNVNLRLESANNKYNNYSNSDMTELMKKSEFRDINDDILRLIYYELILHRLSMSFQISKIKSVNNLEQYNAENVQLLKYYNTLDDNISPNYDYIHQLYLLTEDNNILVQVINSASNENNNGDSDEYMFNEGNIGFNLDKKKNWNLNEDNNSDVNHDVKNEIKTCNYSKNMNPYNDEYEEISTSSGVKNIYNDAITSYKYNYYLHRNGFKEKNEIDFNNNSGQYFNYYTVFNSLSNINYNYVDELLVWQREVPFIKDLVNESHNELINYNYNREDPDSHYLYMSYISSLSIKYFHFSIIPFFNINNNEYSNFESVTEKDHISSNKNQRLNNTMFLNCYSNNYKDCCIDNILNNWLMLIPIKSEFIYKLINTKDSCEKNVINTEINDNSNNSNKRDLHSISYNDKSGNTECNNIIKLGNISCENIKAIIKILEQFIFYNAPPDHPKKLDVEISNNTNGKINEIKSIKILSSWCNILRLKHIDKNINYVDYENNLNPINWFVLHYDSIWNPLIPYKVSICWLSCPVLIISRIFKKISSILLKYSFSIIQIKSSNIYLSYDYNNSNYLYKGNISSCSTLNPPIIYNFKNSFSDTNTIKLLLKKFMSSPLFLQLISFEHGNNTPRFFLMEPHSIYSLELNKNSTIIRLNYHQHFWRFNFKNDSGPILKCICSNSCYDKNWRSSIYYSHLNYIKDIVISIDKNT